MNVTVRVEGSEGADGDVAASLFDWLRRDPTVARAAARVALSDTEDPESLGDAFTVINVVLTHLEALSAIVIAVASWLDGRSAAPPVKIQIEQRHTVMTDGSDASMRKAEQDLADPNAGTVDDVGSGGRDR